MGVQNLFFLLADRAVSVLCDTSRPVQRETTDEFLCPRFDWCREVRDRFTARQAATERRVIPKRKNFVAKPFLTGRAPEPNTVWIPSVSYIINRDTPRLWEYPSFCPSCFTRNSFFGDV